MKSMNEFITNVLPHWNVMTQDMTHHPVRVKRHMTDLLLCCIHRCGTSQWNTHLPMSISWVYILSPITLLSSIDKYFAHFSFRNSFKRIVSSYKYGCYVVV